MTVLFFAGARERVGTGRVVVEVDGGVCLGDAVDGALGLIGGGVALPSNVMLARNGVYVDRSVEVFDGDEVAVIPPVSGGRAMMMDRRGFGLRGMRLMGMRW